MAGRRPGSWSSWPVLQRAGVLAAVSGRLEPGTGETRPSSSPRPRGSRAPTTLAGAAVAAFGDRLLAAAAATADSVSGES